jgi:flagellar hook-associated protein 3 FlgL
MIDTSRNMLYHINNLNIENQRISQQMASGKSIDKGSENSILHSNLINLEGKLRVTEGLQLQIEKTKVMNETAATSINEIKISLGTGENNSIQTDLLKALNSGMDRSDKLALATNLRGIRDNMFDRMNTRVDGEYVFTGSSTNEQTLQKDSDYANNGKITFEGDGFLREVAVQPGSYRDRGITAYDASFYTASKANAGESFTFEEGERVIDENGFEWKVAIDPNGDGKDYAQKYDYNGNIYHPLNTDPFLGDVTTIEIDSKTALTEAWDGITPPTEPSNPQSVRATYTINNIGSSPTGKVFEAKHNYFDDLNITINALEGKATNLDGTKAGTIRDEAVRVSVAAGLEQTSKQFDATNIGHGELGGRNNIFNIAYDKLTTQETHYNILIQETGGADLAKLAMESKALELTYQSLYTTISKMNKLSLLNYIN